VIGTDIGREMYGENVWVVKLITGLQEDADYVIDDVRFPNEAEALRDAGFSILRVDRDADARREYLASLYDPEHAAQLLEHPSEQAHYGINADWIISNRGGIEDLIWHVDDALQKLDHGAPVE
jgi:hypothetical protein